MIPRGNGSHAFAFMRITVAVSVLVLLLPSISRTQASGAGISGPVYKLLEQREAADQAGFAIYVDQDSGLNHGFPSGFFGNIAAVHIDTGCVDSPTAPEGCSADANVLDRARGTVM